MAWGLALMRRSPFGGQLGQLARGGGRPRRRAPRAGSERIHSSSIRRCSAFSRALPTGTWWARNVPSTGLPSTSFGPVQPFGVRRTIAGQRGRSRKPWARVSSWIARMRGHAVVEGGGEVLVDGRRLVALDEPDVVAVAGAGARGLVVARAAEHGRAGDLVPVQVQDRQDGAVAGRVEEADALPRAFERAGLGLAVADDGHHDQVRVVERGPEGVDQHVAELAALVDRARGGRADVAGDAAGRGELAEQVPQPVLVGGDVGVDLRVGALQPDVGDDGRSAVAGPGQEDHVAVRVADDPVEVGVEQVQPGRGAPVAEQAGLHVLGLEGLAQERVVQQVDLADRQVVGRPPVAVEELDLVVGEHGPSVGPDSRAVVKRTPSSPPRHPPFASAPRRRRPPVVRRSGAVRSPASSPAPPGTRRYGGRVALVRRADPADLDALLPLVAEFCAIDGHEFAVGRVGPGAPAPARRRRPRPGLGPGRRGSGRARRLRRRHLGLVGGGGRAGGPPRRAVRAGAQRGRRRAPPGGRGGRVPGGRSLPAVPRDRVGQRRGASASTSGTGSRPRTRSGCNVPSDGLASLHNGAHARPPCLHRRRPGHRCPTPPRRRHAVLPARRPERRLLRPARRRQGHPARRHPPRAGCGLHGGGRRAGDRAAVGVRRGARTGAAQRRRGPDQRVLEQRPARWPSSARSRPPRSAGAGACSTSCPTRPRCCAR